MWLNVGNTFNQANDAASSYKTLPVGIYHLKYNDIDRKFYLNKMSEKFIIPFKVYDIELDFINKITTCFTRLNKDLGVLLQGIKGTGKTVTAKLICNRLELPVIVVSEEFEEEDLSAFIATINQDIILFFDEFEKTYTYHTNILKLLDGEYKTNFKKLSLFTVNSSNQLPKYLFDRPSRIRYVKEFASISESAIDEICYDYLEDKENICSNIKEIKNKLKTISIITIDIIKAICEEINLFGIKSLKEELLNISNSTQDNYVLTMYITSEYLNDLIKNSESRTQLKDIVLNEDIRYSDIPNKIKGIIKTEWETIYLPNNYRDLKFKVNIDNDTYKYVDVINDGQHNFYILKNINSYKNLHLIFLN